MFGDITPTCTALFGSQRTPAVSASLRTLGTTSYELTVQAPALEAPGRTSIALSCRATNVIDAYVMFQAPPRLVSLTSDGGGDCLALAECTFLLLISDPPQTVMGLDDLSISISGASFVGRRGSNDARIRTVLMLVTAEKLLLRIQTPPCLTDATLTGKLVTLQVQLVQLHDQDQLQLQLLQLQLIIISERS